MLYHPLHIYNVHYKKRSPHPLQNCGSLKCYTFIFQGIELHTGLGRSLRGKAMEENKIISSFSSANAIKNNQ